MRCKRNSINERIHHGQNRSQGRGAALYAKAQDGVIEFLPDDDPEVLEFLNSSELFPSITKQPLRRTLMRNGIVLGDVVTAIEASPE